MTNRQITRYVTPLREGGSVPAIVEADDSGTYVAKFSGAAQGPRALAAEVIAAELARELALPIPQTTLVELPPALVRSEPDPELQQLLEKSVGLAFAIDYLPGAMVYDPGAGRVISGELASEIVWFDAWITNIDRTAKNTNLLWWHNKLWLIDHGASLYIHHTWENSHQHAEGRFSPIKHHVLIRQATSVDAAHRKLSALVTPQLMVEVVARVPDEFLVESKPGFTSDVQRKLYVYYLLHRLKHAAFVDEARSAHAASL